MDESILVRQRAAQVNVSGPRPNALNVSFVVEWTLGHRTHGLNLMAVESERDSINGSWHKTHPGDRTSLDRIPKLGPNWTFKSGVATRRHVAADLKRGAVDALYVHTANAATLAASYLDRISSVVSVDATPKQLAAMDGYERPRTSVVVESAKQKITSRALRKAAAVVAVSEWVAGSLVDDYGVEARKIVTIPFGVDLDVFAPSATRSADTKPSRLLFVGGDFVRKGGKDLLAAFSELHQRFDLELDIVTDEFVAVPAGVRVHTGVNPQDAKLAALFAGADLFCLPTYGDCLPLVLLEAAASGLASVSTTVGAVESIVEDGITGLLVAPGDKLALVAAIERLVTDRDLCRDMGVRAADTARAKFCARTNGTKVLELVERVAADGGPR